MAMGVHTQKRGRNAKRAPMAEINVTPLVDVMLVLLIIFMVTAPLMTAGVPVDLPDSRANALPQETDPLDVAIAGDGTIYVGEDAVPQGQLGAALATASEGVSCSEREVILRADRTLDYGRVMGVMGELNRMGCNSISLVTNSSSQSL
ncbi:ExbD/TolR family protein [Alteriqipengyuania lutimaris]|uniref:Biopolymer transporter ExbD n=1 Tax=Alteriqipengyuania lutimaris TaxID=1538146 RepID=A0A395LH13_9SPHN|nr:biopolymer transporter ExbD [Alteriqipengyuania lutimaris]MBB3035000.1 biopolymer transport protein TolR [Alteriqipengyuania lutimaris]RDS76186.1 biopolymer transporter ExbD [Alteriqipengyuania lutimaris]